MYFTSSDFFNHPLVEAVNHDKIRQYIQGTREFIGQYDNIQKINMKENNQNDMENSKNIYKNDRIPKVIQATSVYDPIFDHENLLILFDDIILARSLEDSTIEHEKLPIKHGIDIMDQIIQSGEDFGHFETLIFIFEQIFDPDMIIDKYQLCSFHLFVKHENIRALEYSLKLGININ